MDDRKTRFTIDLEPQFEHMLSELAQTKGTTKADIIRRAVASYNYLAEHTDANEGTKVSITNRRDQVLKDVLLP